MLEWDKAFVDTHATNKSKLKTCCTSNFIKRYPFQEPPCPELGGWDGTFPCLELCIGIGINKAENKDCLLQEGGAFIWSDRTIAKIGNDREKRMRFLLQMVQFFYALMMGNDAIIDSVPFKQYLGPLGPMNINA